MILYVILPVYNEEQTVAQVLAEWIPHWRAATPDFRVDCLDDGSTDGTARVLQELARRHPEVRVTSKPNTGHGQTCVFGYRRALEAGARWVFQLDSDGQCDPTGFAQIWDLRDQAPAVYGFRWPRRDGLLRALISRCLSLVTWWATSVWVPDANVPYRLMSRASLLPVLDRIPGDFHLANVALAVLQCQRGEVRWSRVAFRPRQGGSPSLSLLGVPRRGWQLYRQLRRLCFSA